MFTSAGQHPQNTLKDILFPTKEQSVAASQIDQTSISQPVLFVIEYALAKMSST